MEKRSPSPGAARPLATASSDLALALVPAPLAGLIHFEEGIEQLPAVQKGGVTVALTLKTADQHDAAIALFQEGKRLEEAIKAHYDPAETKLKEWRETLKRLKDGDLFKVSPLLSLLDAGITAYRRRVSDDAAAKAREHAEEDRKRAEAAQKKETERLHALAKQARGQEKKDLIAEAQAVQETPLPSVESTVERIQARTVASFQHPGQAPSATYWSAQIDDLSALVALVVASDEALFARAVELRGDLRRGGWQHVPLEALLGIARVKGLIEASPYLNTQARSLMRRLRIAGVRAVSRDGLRNA